MNRAQREIVRCVFLEEWDDVELAKEIAQELYKTFAITMCVFRVDCVGDNEYVYDVVPDFIRLHALDNLLGDVLEVAKYGD